MSTRDAPTTAATAPRHSLRRRAVHRIAAVGRAAFLFTIWLWCALALYFSTVPYLWVRIVLAATFAGGFLWAGMTSRRRSHTLVLFLACFVAIWLYWLTIRPSHDREWSADQALLPQARVDGQRVTVRNVRHCDYVSDANYTVRYYDKTFDLSAPAKLYFVVEPFGPLPGAAHTFLSFRFGDEFLAVSVEVRREQGETFSLLEGMFKQFEIMYVLGDERDLVLLRANIRNNPVYVYPIRATPAEVRSLFLDVLTRVNRLREQPEFYHTLTNTCTTNIVRHMNKLTERPVPAFRLPVLLPGLADRLAYGRGLIDTELPFAEARRRFLINGRARRHAASEDFSMKIREED
jgi:hypothetical protein